MKKQKILFVWFVPFDGITNGGGRVNRTVADIAAKVVGKCNLDHYFVCDRLMENSLRQRVLAYLSSPLGYFNGLTPDKISEIVSLSRSYDKVFLSSSLMGKVAEALRQDGYRGDICVLFHNVESQYFRIITPALRPGRQLKIWQAARNEKLCCLHADCIMSFNRRDADIISSGYGRTVDYVWPLSISDHCNMADIDTDKMTSTDALRCLFVGSFFAANTESLLWFVDKVMNRVSIHLTVVGKDMERMAALLGKRPDISLAGSVDDIGLYYRDADVVVSPVLHGSGMKTKTCEALMHGKNILGTTETFEGYDIDIDKVGALCNTADDFIKAINTFKSRPVKCFNRYSRSIYEQKYSTEASLKIFREILL